jgi:hypothetical protein
MHTLEPASPFMTQGLRLATVVTQTPLRVRVDGCDIVEPLSTLPSTSTPTGSRVVISATEEGQAIVMGVIGGAPAHASNTSSPQDKTQLAGGFGVCIKPASMNNDDAAVTIYDPQGSPILRFDAAAGTLTLSAAVDLNLHAGRTLRITAPHTEIGSPLPQSPRISVKGDTLRLASPRIETKSTEAMFESHTTTLHSTDASGTFDTLALASRRVKFTADRVQSTLRAAYTDVKELVQLQAQRLKVLVSGSSHIRTKEFNLRADRNVNIDGDQINLG